MTERNRIINHVYGKLARALKNLGIVELNYNEDVEPGYSDDNSIEFPLKGYTVRISVEVKLDKTKKLQG